MSDRRPGRWRDRVPGRTAVLLVLAMLLTACSGAGVDGAAPAPAATPAGDLALATPPPLQPEDRVDLTVYFRSGEGANARLAPVVKEVAVTDDLPRRALELLLAGPGEDEGLQAPLPTSTELLDLDVEGGTARVDLSDDVVTDAQRVGASPANEALGLGALVNTLTEFPSIEQVRLTVDGRSVEEPEAFWGGWGVPEVLVRDESLLTTAEGEGDGVLDLARFSEAQQEIGAPGGAPVRITSVRVRDRLTHTRVQIELADAGDDAAAAAVPQVRVRQTRDGVTLRLDDVAGMDGGGAEAFELPGDELVVVRHELDDRSGSYVLELRAGELRGHWLHSLSNPTRVVLDLRK